MPDTFALIIGSGFAEFARGEAKPPSATRFGARCDRLTWCADADSFCTQRPVWCSGGLSWKKPREEVPWRYLAFAARPRGQRAPYNAFSMPRLGCSGLRAMRPLR